MSNRTVLAQLTSCLRGGLPVAPNWLAILTLANRALVTPQLHAAMVESGAIGQVPEDVRRFLLAVCVRNRERNRRLSVQLGDALRALNSAGIEPVLLKGAAVWASSGNGIQFDRILSDLDVMVKPSEAEHAIDVLERAGSRCLTRYSKEMHVVADLGRPEDVGSIDLHLRPPGPLGVAEIPDLDARCTRISWLGGHARLPSPALQIFFLVLHDQFHEGDYWRGGLDLRHLLDIRDLSKASHSADWLLLSQVCRTPLVRNAVEAQLVAAARLVEAPVPQGLTQRLWSRAQHRRHMWQFARPRLSLPLALVAIVAESPNLVAYWWLNQQHGAKRARNVETRLLGRLAHRARRLKAILLPRAGKL